ncbi:EutN/CcmL family microcompartment protein [Schinkia azotoformans]|uniref:EutN/CcmL family microcompartment protein n=1 Tax=Schinkia azotoformans TaxID=1454 RepID=UPI002E1BDD02|nr:EutN/CcmL family microcompartment protein [Schinkia azotoformans]
MIVGKVVGSLWATRKDEKLNGFKFLVIEPLYKNDGAKDYFVAADNAGAGVSDTVLITTGGGARASIENPEIPVDAVIVGVVDSIDIETE